MRTLIATCTALFVLVLAAGCSADPAPPASAPSTLATAPSTSTAAPRQTQTSSAPTAAGSPSAKGTSRAEVCRAMVAYLEQLRDTAAGLGDKGWTPHKAVEDIIAELPNDPNWAGMSEQDKDNTIKGTRDAATGRCG